MGGNSSQDIEFQKAFETLKFSGVSNENLISLISTVGCLQVFSGISNLSFQLIYKDQPDNIKKLTLLCIQNIQSTESTIIRGSIITLNHLIPTLFLTVNDPMELDWLFQNKSSLISEMYSSLIQISFKSGIFNPENVEDNSLWTWKHITPPILQCRISLLQLFFYTRIPSFFFEQYPSTQSDLISVISFDQKYSSKLIHSISPSIFQDEIDFEIFALPFITMMCFHDKNFLETLCNTNFINLIVDQLYLPISNHNSLLTFSGINIEPIETDLLLLFLLIMLNKPNSIIPRKEAVLSLIERLQQATEEGKASKIHKITLVSLSKFTEDNTRFDYLFTPLDVSLNTRFAFHSDSIMTSLLEAVVLSLQFNQYRELAISIMHNIAPFLPFSDSVIPMCFTKALQMLLSQTQQDHLEQQAHIATNTQKVNDSKINYNIECLEQYLVALERYVSGEHKEEKKALMKSLTQKLFTSLKIDQFMKERIIETINSNGTDHYYPLVIEQIQELQQWINSMVIQLFERRNKRSLMSLKSSQN